MITLAELTEVWTPLATAFAVVAGLALGYFVIGRVGSDPAYASGKATAVEYGTTTAFLTAAVGLVFYSFQALGTYLDHDPSWTRVVSRYCLWALYSVCIGVGVTARFKTHADRKHAEAHQRAVDEINKGS